MNWIVSFFAELKTLALLRHDQFLFAIQIHSLPPLVHCPHLKSASIPSPPPVEHSSEAELSGCL